MEIKQVNPNDLKPAEYNPRQMTEKQAKDLTVSIKKFGLVDPIIVNSNKKRYNTIIGGHQRLEIALRESFKTVPVYYIDLDEKSERELNLRLNKNLGEWNWDMLANLDEDLLREVGFDDELDKIFGLDAEEDDFDVVLPEEPVTKLGDIIELGRHRLMCGDATKIEDVEKLMAGKTANMTFTDPPYNVDYGATMKDTLRGNKQKIMNDKMSDEDFDVFLSDSLVNILSITDGAIYVCMSSSEMGSLQDAFKKNGGHWSTFIIWAKNTFTMGKSDYQRQYEPILYGWKEGGKHHWCGDRNQGDVWNID